VTVLPLYCRLRQRREFRKLVKATFKAVQSPEGEFMYVYNSRKKKSQWHVPFVAKLSEMDCVEQGSVAPPNRRGPCSSLNPRIGFRYFCVFSVAKPKLDENYHRILGEEGIVLVRPVKSEVVKEVSTAQPYSVVIPPEEQFLVLFDPLAKRHFYYNRVSKRSTMRRPKEMHISFGDSKRPVGDAGMPPDGSLVVWI
jgi:hypothetical protein